MLLMFITVLMFDPNLDTNSSNSDAENDEKLRDVLSTEAQSMLAELAEDNSGI